MLHSVQYIVCKTLLATEHTLIEIKNIFYEYRSHEQLNFEQGINTWIFLPVVLAVLLHDKREANRAHTAGNGFVKKRW